MTKIALKCCQNHSWLKYKAILFYSLIGLSVQLNLALNITKYSLPLALKGAFLLADFFKQSNRFRERRQTKTTVKIMIAIPAAPARQAIMIRSVSEKNLLEHLKKNSKKFFKNFSRKTPTSKINFLRTLSKTAYFWKYSC